MLCGFSQSGSGIENLGRISDTVDGYGIFLPGRRHGELNRPIVPIEPVHAGLNRLRLETVCAAGNLRDDFARIAEIDLQIDPFTGYDDGVFHRCLSPRLRPSNFQRLSGWLATGAGEAVLVESKATAAIAARSFDTNSLFGCVRRWCSHLFIKPVSNSSLRKT